MLGLETPEFQPSLAEWFNSIGNSTLAETMRQEDNTRTERFLVLKKYLNLPADVPEIFSVTEMLDKSDRWVGYYNAFANFPCAIRLVPNREGLPKLRNRGLLLKDCYEQWFLKQTLNPADYVAEVYRHCANHIWSTIIAVNERGIMGEVIAGQHNQLTKGETKTNPMRFFYNFSDWHWQNPIEEAKPHVFDILNQLQVSENAVQNALINEMSVKFYNDYLAGYFETVLWDTGELFFVDFNREIATALPDVSASFKTGASADIKGVCAYPGTVTGVARVLDIDAGTPNEFNDGNILVARNTDVRYVPYMQRASAIVTAYGGILSHAAIVARELKKPCIVAAQKVLSDVVSGDTLLVDATQGIIKKIV